jgi:hypothetical protein
VIIDDTFLETGNVSGGRHYIAGSLQATAVAVSLSIANHSASLPVARGCIC